MIEKKWKSMAVATACLSLSLLGTLALTASSPTEHAAPTAPAAQTESTMSDTGAKTVKITAKRFGFSPNQITLKKGEPVKLELTSEDVTHGFYMKALKLDEVVVPGKPTIVNLTPQTAGKFTTICDHFCGAGHGNMNMSIVVEE